MNIKVREHADTVWSKVEEIQGHQHQQQHVASVQGQVQVPGGNSTPSGRNFQPGDLEYRKKIFKDHLLYLTEALDLPTSGTVAEQWRDKSESDVCQAMRNLENWKKSTGKL